MATEIIDIGSATIGISGQAIHLMPIVADPIGMALGVTSGATTTKTIVNRDNDISFFCRASRVNGVPENVISLQGFIDSATIFIDPIGMTNGVSGSPVMGTVIDISLDMSLSVEAKWYIASIRNNWVEWSKIGEASFIRDRTNEAGDRPMSWNGWAWRVLKLGELVIVYGDNGICVMTPVTDPVATFGFKDIAKVGIKSPWSVAGTDHVHFFITGLGELWKFTSKGPERLGFKEFLSPLTNPVLNYDETNDRLFISDGSSGYVYDEGLGGGYASITGITNAFVTSPSAMPAVPISIMTDTIDLGHRGIKTLTFVEIGTDTTEDLFVSVDFRYTKDEAWRSSEWVKTNPEGVARITVAAVEFRVRIKQTTYDELRIDYINVRHQRSDSRFLRGPIFEQPDQGEF